MPRGVGVTFEKDQVAHAKRHSLPLCCIAIDRRYVPKDAKHTTSWSMKGPMGPTRTAKLYALLLEFQADDPEVPDATKDDVGGAKA